MGVRNVLVEGVSGSGKSSVARELRRRGVEVLDGDRELAAGGGDAAWSAEEVHAHHRWDAARVRAACADATHPVTFFCGGARNHADFLDLMDAVVVLEIDAGTLERRLATRPLDEFGGREEERTLIRRLHATREDLPRPAIPIDATRPLTEVVDAILAATQPSEGPRS